MKKIYSFLLSALILLVFNACQDFEVPEYQGEVNFSLDNVQFSNTAVPNARIETNSPWKHIYKPNAVLNITHTASGKEYTLDYNPNTFGTFSRTLPYGAYTFESTVAGGVFEEFLPYTTSGEFRLESEKLEISLTATTEYGLISVKNQSVSEAKVTAGTTTKNLKLLDDKTYYYIYAKAQTATALAITETVFGTTINRTIPMLAYKHFNYIIDLKQGNLNLIDLVLDPFGYEEETISSVSFKFFEENGTIKCPNTIPGETGIVNGKKYESVDRALLIQRRDEGADLTCVCTTLVTDMSNMFAGTDQNRNTFNQAIGNWDVSNVTKMNLMFLYSDFDQPIGNWDVSNVQTMDRMFSNSPFNQEISNWNVSKVKDMTLMFSGTPFNQPIENWNVSNVTTMYFMFSSARSFNQPIGKWNVSKVQNMYAMFNFTPFNQPLEKWDVSNVLDMSFMFNQAPFNQNISNWCVTNITNEPEAFAAGSPLSSQNKPVWGTCPTTIVDVFNPATGKTWMDRNLGASRAATSSTDAAAYGDLYQWGRGADGHQLRNSPTTTALSTQNQPGNRNYILTPNLPSDWRSPQNDNLWQGVNGINNPCPDGYRLPTEAELNAERLSWSSNNAAGAFASPLKLPMAGDRYDGNGSLTNINTHGSYWSNTVSSTNSQRLGFISSDAGIGPANRGYGLSVRCIKN